MTRGDLGDGVDEELADARRAVPRWLVPVAALAVLAVVVALVVAHRHTSSPRAVPVSTSPSTAASTAPFVAQGPVTGVGHLVADPAESRLFALTDDHLYTVDLLGQQSGPGVTLPPGFGAQQPALLVDAARHRLWLVPEVVRAGPSYVADILELDTRSLGVVGAFAVRQALGGAAVLDGQLYVSGAGTLYRLDPSGGLAVLLTTAAADLDLSTDPVRHRLVFLERGRSFALGFWSPAGRIGTVVLHLRVSGLVTVDGSAWVVGGSQGGGVLARVDLRTLRPGPNVAARDGFGPDLGRDDGVGDAASVHSFFVVDGADRPGHEFCLDAGTGRVLARVSAPHEAYATVDGRTYEGPTLPLRRVSLGRCPG